MLERPELVTHAYRLLEWTLGIFGDDNDQPWYPHPRACTDEYYGYQTSQFLWAVLALQDLTIA